MLLPAIGCPMGWGRCGCRAWAHATPNSSSAWSADECGCAGWRREMPGLATAVELYGKRDCGKEERLELRMVGGRDGLDSLPGPAPLVSGTGSVSTGDWDKNAIGLPRILRNGNRPIAKFQAALDVKVSCGRVRDRDHASGTGRNGDRGCRACQD